MSEAQSFARLKTPLPAERIDQADGFLNLDFAVRDPTDGIRATTNGGLWERQVAAWKLLGPPLRPSPEDVDEYDAIVANWSRQHGPPRGLVLGATPELARLRWPTGANVLAVDRSPAMIQRVWPGHPQPGQGGMCGDWLDLPLPDHSRDLVLGDGPFTQLDYPEGYRSVARSLRRVLTGSGTVTIRFFIKPDIAESPEQVLADLWSGRIGSFHVFKWRLAMALQERVEQGVQLHTIWNYWADSIDPNELARRRGWPLEVISTIENYRGLAARYTFPTLDELRQVLRMEFTELSCHIPKYELGERCPILTFRPSPAATRQAQKVAAAKLEKR